MRFEYDASRNCVFLLYGYLVVDVVSLGLFKEEFGVSAVRRLIHGDAVRR